MYSNFAHVHPSKEFCREVATGSAVLLPLFLFCGVKGELRAPENLHLLFKNAPFQAQLPLGINQYLSLERAINSSFPGTAVGWILFLNATS